MNEKKYVIVVAVTLDDGSPNMVSVFHEEGITFHEAMANIHKVTTQVSADTFPFREQVVRVTYSIVTPEFMHKIAYGMAAGKGMPPGNKSH